MRPFMLSQRCLIESAPLGFAWDLVDLLARVPLERTETEYETEFFSVYSPQ